MVPAILYFSESASSQGGFLGGPDTHVKIHGDDELHAVDVELISGKKRMLTDSIVTVEEIFGQDPHATSWFFIGTDVDGSGVGSAGDTVRVQIPAAVTPLNAIYPAVDVTTTVTAGMVADDNPERALALQICVDLESDSDFQDAEWDCIVIPDHSGVFIENNLFNEFGERTSWTVTSTGTTVTNKAFDDIVRRGLPTELARSPNDPREGILGIAGTVTSTPGGIGDIDIEFFKNSAASNDMRLDCDPYVAGTCDFKVECSATKDKFINAIRVFGGCNGIKFGQHLCKNQDLSNGVEITIISDSETLVLPIINSTEDWKNKFSFGTSGPGGTFRIDVQSGADQFVAQFSFASPAVIRKCGSIPTPNDEIIIKIQDDLDGAPGGNLNEFSALVNGFQKEP